MKNKSTQIVNYAKYLSFVLIALLVTSVYISLSDGEMFQSYSLFDSKVLSVLLSVAVLIIIGIFLYMFSYKNFNSEGSLFLPLLFITLVLLNPRSVLFDISHIILLLLVSGVLFSAKYSFDRTKLSMIFYSTLLFSIAATFLPGLIILVLINIVLNITKDNNSPKYYLTVISALLMPLIYIISFNYILDGSTNFNTIWHFILSDISAVSLPSIPYRASAIALIIYLTYLTFRALSYLINSMKAMKVNQERSLTIIIFLGLAVILMSLLYAGHRSTLATMMIFIPISYLIFYLFQNAENKREIQFSFWFLMLLIAFFRVNEFVGF